jgi:putative phosphoribosyl transferase
VDNHRFLSNRREAGQQLADKLSAYANSRALVLAVPRGGIPVACEIAKALHLSLDVVLVKKIGHPQNKEYAVGAVSTDSSFINPHEIVDSGYVERETNRLQQMLKEKYIYYESILNERPLKDRVVILVDDGMATGSTMLAAIRLLRQRQPLRIVVAVPVMNASLIPFFNQQADALIYLLKPLSFSGVGAYYHDFHSVSDEEALALLQAARSNE